MPIKKTLLIIIFSFIFSTVNAEEDLKNLGKFKDWQSFVLLKEGVKEVKLNQELLKVVDIRYGKPYEEETTQECDKFIFKLISGSKNEIKKIAESGIY